MIEVSFTDVDKDAAEGMERAVKYVNSICDYLSGSGYKQGYRNNIAVDLSIVCYVLALNPCEVAKEAWSYRDIMDHMDDLYERCETIGEYLEGWSNYGQDIFDKMLMLDEWIANPPEEEWVKLNIEIKED